MLIKSLAAIPAVLAVLRFSGGRITPQGCYERASEWFLFDRSEEQRYHIRYAAKVLRDLGYTRGKRIWELTHKGWEASPPTRAEYNAQRRNNRNAIPPVATDRMQQRQSDQRLLSMAGRRDRTGNTQDHL